MGHGILLDVHSGLGSNPRNAPRVEEPSQVRQLIPVFGAGLSLLTDCCLGVSDTGIRASGDQLRWWIERHGRSLYSDKVQN